VQSIGVAPDGSLYCLSNKTVQLYTPNDPRGWKWTAISDSGIQSFAVAPDGDVYCLGNATVQLYTPNSPLGWKWTPESSNNVQSFVMTADGTLYALATGANLLVSRGGNVWRVVRQTVRAFAAGNGGTVLYALQTDGFIWQYREATQTWQRFFGPIQSFQLASDGTLASARKQDGTSWTL
jgi:hypothetical protein